MTPKSTIILFALLFAGLHAFGQQEDKEDKAARLKARADNAAFGKQIKLLKEYKAELKKLPKLSKENGHPCKIVVEIDSASADDVIAENMTINGFIKEDLGNMSVTAYELQFDRATQKIVAVKNDLDGDDKEDK
ncbi:MAG: hypothetical protein ACTHJ0_00345 [Flavipsychrobacter sp.]